MSFNSPSVAEIRTIALRMLDAMKKKAERGELRRLLPPGYLYDVDGKPVKDPNPRVQEAIGLVFSKFRELGSGFVKPLGQVSTSLDLRDLLGSSPDRDLDEEPFAVAALWRP